MGNIIPRLYINQGHSDKDPGAVGFETERKLNVAVSNHMRDYLLANYVVEIRMNSGTMGNLYSICKDANDWGADLFVSNHFNAGGGDGYEALVYSEKRRALGQIFEKHVKAVGQNSRGVKIRTGLVVLRDTNMPAVLNEGAFVDNKADITDWNDDAELKKLGTAYAKAAVEAMKLERKAQPEPAPQPEKDNDANKYALNMRSLSKGCKGDDVKALQILLNGRGYSCGIADGDFGNQTHSAVCKYQAATNRVKDGVAGPDTMSGLMGV